MHTHSIRNHAMEENSLFEHGQLRSNCFLMLLGQIFAVRFAKDRKNKMQSLEMPFDFSEKIVLDVFN
jgi:hypothetical protein